MSSHENLARSQLFDVTRAVVIDPAETFGLAGQLAASAKLAPGTVVDAKYKILSVLGTGGMGAVYRAQHLNLDKEVALKTLLSENLSADSWTRFQREARALAQLNHKNIVHVFDFGVSTANVPFYTMECLSGQSLADDMFSTDKSKADKSLREVLDIFIQIGEALAVAHRKNIIHRDIKPANIFLAREKIGGGGEKIIPKVVDFGIASLATGAGTSADGDSDKDQHLTIAGRVFGSPLYMSPEQAEGKPLGPQSDIYSFACALFEVICSSPPYQGDNVFDTMRMHQSAPIPSMADYSNVRLPQHLVALTARMLAKAPETRPASFDDVVAGLRAVKKSLKEDVLIKRRERFRKVGGTTTGTGSTTSNRGARPAKSWATIAAAVALLVASAAGMTYFLTVNNPRQVQHKEAQLDDTLSKMLRVDPLSVTPNSNLVKFDQNDDKRTPPTHVARYFQGTRAGRKYFNFPAKIFKIGYFTTSNAVSGQDFAKVAVGAVDFPADAQLNLHAGADVGIFPQLMDGFEGADIHGLTFDPHTECSNECINHIKQMTGLQHLGLRGAEVDDAALQAVDKLSNLRSINLRNTHISAVGLSKLRRLRSINALLISGMADTEPLVKALLTVPANRGLAGDTEPNTKLGCLGLSNCGLSDSDMDQMIKLPVVSQLDISNNPQLTGKTVAKLVKMPFLALLDISLTQIDYKYAIALSKITHLRQLIVSNKNWSTSAVESMKRLKPGLLVENHK